MADKLAGKLWWCLFCVLLALAPKARALGTIDYAQSLYSKEWLHHPVYGDPSFDSFLRSPANPIYRATPPLELSGHGFLFLDPTNVSRYAYIAEKGLSNSPSHCILYRSIDLGKTWKNQGVVLKGDSNQFDHGGSITDVSVVFDQGRYHMVYDWQEPGETNLGGLGYAWSEQPEGPFHRAREPITRNQKLPVMLGRYQRTYGATLIRRKNDWLILGVMDNPPNSWCYFGMTAPKPEGPYSDRVILRNVESNYYHPPLLEFFPAFVDHDWVYAPATSLALNRNYNVMFRVPVEKAMRSSAWDIWQDGSLWHSDDVENETYGLWGQTFSGVVASTGYLLALFPSRDKNGFGTMNLAGRLWRNPMKTVGFVLTGHQGSSLTLLGKAYNEGRLQTRLKVRGTARLMLDYHSGLGPNIPEANATLHPASFTRCDFLEMSSNRWQLIQADENTNRVVASGRDIASWNLDVQFDQTGKLKILDNNRLLYLGNLGPKTNGWTFGLEAQPDTHISSDTFKITGEPHPAKFNFLSGDGLLGAGEKAGDWIESHGPEFRFGVGAVANADKKYVKWNVQGRRVTLWSPKGPHFGRILIRVDGQIAGGVDLHADQPEPSKPVWTSHLLTDSGHAITLSATEGKLVVDSIEVEQ